MNPFPLTVTHRNLALILLKGEIAILLGHLLTLYPVTNIPISATNLPREPLKITVEDLVIFATVIDLFHQRNLFSITFSKLLQ